MFDQTISLVGATLILVAYVLNQRGRLGPRDRTYALLNLCGSLLLLWIAIVDWRLGFIVLEGAWAAVSLPALVSSRRPEP